MHSAAACLLQNAHLFLVDPAVLRRLPALDLLVVEPQRDLLLRGVDGVRAVADVAADVLSSVSIDIARKCTCRTYDGEVTTDGTWSRCKRVGGAEEGTAGLDGVTTLPDHCADGTAGHVCVSLCQGLSLSLPLRVLHTGNETLEEGLVAQVGIVLLEVLGRGGHELDGNELEAGGRSKSSA